MNLNNWRLAQRLWIGFGAVLLLAIGLSAVGMARLKSTQRDFGAALALDQQAAWAERWSQLTQLNVSRALAIAKSGGHAELRAFLDPQMKATSEAINAVQKEITAQPNGEPALQLIGRIAELRSAYLAMRQQLLARMAGDAVGTQQAVTSQLLPAAQAYLGALDAFRKQQLELARERASSAETTADRAIVMIGVLALVCLACGIAASAAITRSVTRPLQQAVELARRIAQCDLTGTVQTQGRDELVQLLQGLDTMQQRLREVVGTVHKASDSIEVASREVAAGSLDLSNRTEHAAANLQQTAASTEQIAATVGHTAESAAQAKTLAGTACSVTAQGAELVDQLQQAMLEITSQSARIGDITTLIDGIAFQTNLLALNAAVEAARAGEQGRGFAVVAGEVRSLAGRAAAAARQIKQLVEGSAQAASQAALLAQTTRAAMQNTADSVAGVDTIISSISNASREQSLGVEQLNRSLGELDQTTQQNAALVEQSAAAAASLQEQAAALARIVGVFRLHAEPPAGAA